MSDIAQSTESLFNDPTATEAKPQENIQASATTAETSSTFLDSVSEEFRSEACLQDIKDLNSLVKSYVHAQKRMGGMVKIPGEDATDEDRNEFLNKLGRPATPEEYGINNPLAVDERFKQFAPELDGKIKEFTQLAHKLGISKAAASELVNYQTQEFLKEIDTTVQSSQVELESARKMLKETWKDEFDANVSSAIEMKNLFASKYPEQMQQLTLSGAERNPVFMMMMSELGRTIKESGSKATVEPMDTDPVVSAHKQLEAVKADLNHPFWNPQHPEYSVVAPKINELYRTIYKG